MIDALSFAMQSLLEWYLGFSAPLVALALLSLIVFVLMLPLYHFGDKLLLAEKQRKALMQAEMGSIQETEGRRKYFYTKEIYRRHGYHPLYSLIGLFGLALQLPFFVAAYQMLGHFAPFDGLAAPPFANLQQPDALLSFWGLTLNLLPLLMTLLNLLSAYFYAESPEERRKIWLFPALFLVLLYQQPVALVFYWTMNNVFSLAKNLWQAQKRSWHRLPPLRERLCQYADAWRSAQAVHIGLLLFALLLGLLYFLYTDRDREIPSLWINSSLALLFYLGLYFGATFRPARGLSRPSSNGANGCKWRKWLWAALLIASFAGLLVLAVLSYRSAQAGNLQAVLKIREKILLLRPFVLLLEVAALVVAGAGARPQGRTQRLVRTLRKGRKISGRDAATRRYALAMGGVFVGIFWSVPARVIASDPASFEGYTDALQLTRNLLLFALVPFALLMLLYLLVPKRLQGLRGFASVLVLMPSWFINANLLLFRGNYGEMEFTSFKSPLQISNNEIAFSGLLLGVLCSALMGIYLLLPQKAANRSAKPNALAARLDMVLWLFLALHAASIASSLYQIARYHRQLSAPANAAVSAERQNGKASAQNLAQQIPLQIPLSRSANNIVILMLDKFMGGILPEVLRANPEMQEKLEGFTFYPNSVSQGSRTIGGFHPIVGGSEYTVEKMNQNKRPLSADIIEAFTMIPNALQGQGFASYFVNVEYDLASSARGAMQSNLNALGVQTIQTSLDYNLLPASANVRSQAKVKLKWHNFLAMLGVFQAFGPIFRQKIYDDGRWLGLLGSSSLWAAIAFWEPYIQLLELKTLFQPSEEFNGTYALIYNLLPHNTGFADAHSYYANPENFHFALPPIPQVVQEQDEQNDNQNLATLFLANYQTLYLVIEWLEQLKQQGLYDNTLIYLVSDHGSGSFDPSFAIQGWGPDALTKSNWHILYMRKDLNSRAPFQISGEFRTNADIPAEFLPQFGITHNPYSGKRLQPVQSNPLPLYHVGGGIERTETLMGNDYQFYTRNRYHLKNFDIFTDENWEFVR